jgi:hypothetical protein
MSEPWQPDGPEPRRGGFISRQSFAKHAVRIVHADGSIDEEVAHVRGGTGFFDVEATISEGDVVELGERRLAVTHATLRDTGPRLMRHIQVTLGDAPAASPAPSVKDVRQALAGVDARLAELEELDGRRARDLMALATELRRRLDG